MEVKGIPVHICDKAPTDKPMLLSTTHFRFCPYCKEPLKGGRMEGPEDSKNEKDPYRYEKGPGLDSRLRHGSPIFYALLEKMAKTHDKKSHDYASDGDPYANYKFAGMMSKLFNNPDDAGFVGRIGEKLYRLANLENSQKVALNETIEDTEEDLCVIMVLWMAARRDQRMRGCKISNTSRQSLKDYDEVLRRSPPSDR